MSQYITVLIKILPTKEQAAILEQMCKLYISTINTLVSEMVKERKITKKTSKDVHVLLPSTVKNQAIEHAKKEFKKVKKSNYKNVPVLKSPVCIWNNQGYSFNDTHISMTIWINGNASKTPFRALFDKDNRNLRLLQQHKKGTLLIKKKGNKWIAHISVIPNLKLMAVDLGIKVPAVAVTDDGKVRFFGNGRKNKYMRRKFHSQRRELGKRKKINAIKRLGDKEQRWMRDQDHKVSRSIVNFAIENEIAVIRLEELAKIRQTTRTIRKNEKNLHTWSFYRLTHYIEYKANLAGIKVEYVDPAYTSQTCPQCSKRNKAKDRKYKCLECGFEKHRDLVGALNILNAPVINGNS